MSVQQKSPLTSDATRLLQKLRGKGVHLWVEDGSLHYRGPKGALDTDDIAGVRELRAGIMTILDGSSNPPTETLRLAPRTAEVEVPLSFSQQWAWNRFPLEKRPSTRMVASAIRLKGDLNVEHLRTSFTTLVHRHETLRTNISCAGGTVRQQINPPHTFDLEVIDLTRLPQERRETTARELAERIVGESVFVGKDPLFCAKLLRIAPDDHVVVVAIDHIVSDAASLGIVWRELFWIYDRLARALPIDLSPIAIQFGDYAVWQRKDTPTWACRHAPYWQGRLSGARRVRLIPGDTARPSPSKWTTLPVRLGVEPSCALRTTSRQQRTTTVMGALTAYSALLTQWRGTSDLVVPFVTMGRLQPEVQATVGYFSSPLYLRIELTPQMTFLDLLAQISNEYATAYSHHDACRIVAATPTPEFAANPHFNWIPGDFSIGSPDIFNTSTDVSPGLKQRAFETHFQPEVQWECEIQLILTDNDRQICGWLGFPATPSATAAAGRLARNLGTFVTRLSSEPHSRVVATSCAP